MILYLDTSAMASVLLREDRAKDVERIISPATTHVVLSDLAEGEFSAVVSTAVRSERLTEAEARYALGSADAWAIAVRRIQTTAEDMREATGLVRRFELKLLFPDALHLALCARADAHLITGDHRQAKAADAIRIPVTLI